tara:strand:+ start:1075 stop:1650 length:576 start_codon:yes stop_codon:yes gene_type:complete
MYEKYIKYKAKYLLLQNGGTVSDKNEFILNQMADKYFKSIIGRNTTNPYSSEAIYGRYFLISSTNGPLQKKYEPNEENTLVYLNIITTDPGEKEKEIPGKFPRPILYDTVVNALFPIPIPKEEEKEEENETTNAEMELKKTNAEMELKKTNAVLELNYQIRVLILNDPVLNDPETREKYYYDIPDKQVNIL